MCQGYRGVLLFEHPILLCVYDIGMFCICVKEDGDIEVCCCLNTSIFYVSRI